ncbi:MAG: AraC family transcriptional regulator [Opitutaceae bacterium]|jgi:AraC-like DNA-binding protein
MSERPHVTIKPPPGRPCWVSHGDLPLLYLGWGKRDFERYPLKKHYDIGTSFYLVLKGDLVLSEAGVEHRLTAPSACIIDKECLSGVTSGHSASVEILVWVWRDLPHLDELKTVPGGVRKLRLRPESLPRILELHRHCRDEVARTDASVHLTLAALRTLVEVELSRASGATQADEARQWELVREWISANLAIHAPIPALCDYLRMSPSTLNRFFVKLTGMAPGAFFRKAKKEEALRLIQNEGWTVKTTAFHLGYRHATDLSRVLAK